MRQIAIASILAAALLTGTSPAAAQYQMVSPMLYHGPAISYRDHVNAHKSASSGPNGAGESSSAAPAPASFTYRADPARRRANLAQFVEKVRAVDPQGADNLAAEFAQGDFIARLQEHLTPYGLHVDNVADAYATYWISAFQASRGDSSTPARPIVEAVKAQAARSLAGTPDFMRSADSAKQEMAEALWVQAALLDIAVSGAKDKPEDMRLVGQAAMAGARGMGLDLAKMTLTDKGFVLKDG